MANNLYQIIFDEVDQYNPFSNWEKMVIFLIIGDGFYQFSFFIKHNGDYIDCFDLPGISADALMDSFDKIYEAIEPIRESADEPWSNMTMIVDSQGNMHSDYDYTDLSEGTAVFMENWRKKYLI